MSNQQPIITVTAGRQLVTSPAAVLVFIFNEAGELLLLAHPKRGGAWEVVNGALDAEETILEGALREAGEEIGRTAVIEPVGICHAYTFRYDDYAQYMISLCVVAHYQGGEIVPGDDMVGSMYRWWSLAELAIADVQLVVPSKQMWLLRRAQQTYRLWRAEQVELQPVAALDSSNKPKAK
ncbi:MAG TPA: NUDIX hydrolase [Anaerolineae bacterium]|nr:NUDIX hydrolase [Anaerolineae bacterium]